MWERVLNPNWPLQPSPDTLYPVIQQIMSRWSTTLKDEQQNNKYLGCEDVLVVNQNTQYELTKKGIELLSTIPLQLLKIQSQMHNCIIIAYIVRLTSSFQFSVTNATKILVFLFLTVLMKCALPPIKLYHLTKHPRRFLNNPLTCFSQSSCNFILQKMVKPLAFVSMSTLVCKVSSFQNNLS